MSREKRSYEEQYPLLRPTGNPPLTSMWVYRSQSVPPVIGGIGSNHKTDRNNGAFGKSQDSTPIPLGQQLHRESMEVLDAYEEEDFLYSMPTTYSSFRVKSTDRSVRRRSAHDVQMLPRRSPDRQGASASTQARRSPNHVSPGPQATKRHTLERTDGRTMGRRSQEHRFVNAVVGSVPHTSKRPKTNHKLPDQTSPEHHVPLRSVDDNSTDDRSRIRHPSTIRSPREPSIRKPCAARGHHLPISARPLPHQSGKYRSPARTRSTQSPGYRSQDRRTNVRRYYSDDRDSPAISHHPRTYRRSPNRSEDYSSTRRRRLDQTLPGRQLHLSSSGRRMGNYYPDRNGHFPYSDDRKKMKRQNSRNRHSPIAGQRGSSQSSYPGSENQSRSSSRAGRWVNMRDRGRAVAQARGRGPRLSETQQICSAISTLLRKCGAAPRRN